MSEDNGNTPWPPTPEEAPTPAELLEQISEFVQRGTTDVPDPEDVLEAFRELIEAGSPEYQTADGPIEVLDQLMQRLDDEERALLREYEEQANERSDRWAADRFRIGYALGTALRRIVD